MSSGFPKNSPTIPTLPYIADFYYFLGGSAYPCPSPPRTLTLCPPCGLQWTPPLEISFLYGDFFAIFSYSGSGWYLAGLPMEHNAKVDIKLIRKFSKVGESANDSRFHGPTVLGKNDCLHWLVFTAICLNLWLFFFLVS